MKTAADVIMYFVAGGTIALCIVAVIDILKGGLS